MTAPRQGGWVQTYTGKQFWPLDPLPEEVCIEDIAHALSMKCRYGGHSTFFYSVAEHSVLVSKMVPPEHARSALMHDAAEAYLPDVARPIKRSLTGFAEIEANVEAAIARRFGLDWPWSAEIHEADATILADEKAALMVDAPASWHLPHPPAGVKIRGWFPEDAERKFLQRWGEMLDG